MTERPGSGPPPREPSNEPPSRPRPGEPRPLPVSSAAVALWGTAVWVVALAVTLAVPALHSGDRSWWPWSCVTGIALGLFGWTYVRRSRGAADGRPQTRS